MFDVILYHPEIPPNTGNVIRLCANTGCRLHLVEPLGFSLEDAKLRRAGLDYHERASVTTHPSYEACLEALAAPRVFTFSTLNRHLYAEARFAPGDALLFGPETRGLPPALRQSVPPEHRLCLPMTTDSRSVNLSNSVAVVVFEAWRQNGFAGRAPSTAG